MSEKARKFIEGKLSVSEFLEEGPVETDEDDSRRFVFKIPDTPGEEFTAEFQDGSTSTFEIPESTAGMYALIIKGKNNASEAIDETWEDKPSEEEVDERIQELKGHGS